MASPPFDIVQTVPGDSDIASQFPALERSFRDIVESWLLVNHNNLGMHNFTEFADQAASFPNLTSGNWGIWNSSGVLHARLGLTTDRRVVVFPPGTRQLFPQTAPPLGWTLDASAVDRVLMINGTGGSTGGSWNISGAVADSHTLTIAEMPSHQHDIFYPKGLQGTVNPVGGSNQSAVDTNPTTNGSGPMGGGGGHTHTVSNNGAWRPLYLDSVVGVLS